ncbi:hypothetical protein [Limnoglobus roseus]|uniref:Uncharacterized protein n=1 Tax=Limnoglobus roseus TaxID=2598579 RepID=A0A5C1A4L9_9BACT|nr:hypothetical protein [Limnoglobus roseus]QEL14061.1 hypothetical protein PX52LOC_00924 [Limnoglobus roseus]
MNTPEHAPSPPDAAGHGLIELHLRDVRQLFDALDPSPFREKDLDPDAEEYIVDSAKELPPGGPRALVIHLDQPTGLPDEERAVGDAVRVHFVRRARLLRRDLRRLFRRGLMSLAIGVAFLAAVIAAARLIGPLLGETAVGVLSHEGLVILGWVAMWRPLEIFLYDWWPILGEQRIRDRLSRIEVRVVPGSARDRDDLARLLTGADGAPTRVFSSSHADQSQPLPSRRSTTKIE